MSVAAANLSGSPFTGMVALPGIGRLDPQPDITALESAQLMQFSLCIIVPTARYNQASVAAWLKERGLDRHFKAAENKPNG